MLWWHVNEQGVLASIQSNDAWPNLEVKTAFLKLIGSDLDDLHDCKTAVQLAGLEVMLICEGNRPSR